MVGTQSSARKRDIRARPLTKSDFAEDRRGVLRVLPPLTHRIASGPHAEVFPVMARDASTPILFFSKGRYVPRRWFTNAVASPGPEKEAHPWQRPLSNVAYYLERLSEPGELVCDPLLGGGTTAVAAQHLGRRFIGCDVDPGAVEVTLERLHGIEGSRTIKGHLEPRDEEPCG